MEFKLEIHFLPSWAKHAKRGYFNHSHQSEIGYRRISCGFWRMLAALDIYKENARG